MLLDRENATFESVCVAEEHHGAGMLHNGFNDNGFILLGKEVKQ